MNENVMLAFGLTLFAGLSTGIGSALAFFSKRTNTKFLSIALGFSAGVMLYVSFVEIFVKARDALAVDFGEALPMPRKEITPQRLFELSRTLLWEGFKPSRGPE